MSEMSIASDRFWNEFKADIAGTLSDAQKQEIERVISASSTPVNEQLSDLRLSFEWFFVRLVWGPEKRSPERIKREQDLNPPMARRNLPMLASLFAGYMAFWYAALVVATLVFLYFLN